MSEDEKKSLEEAMKWQPDDTRAIIAALGIALGAGVMLIAVIRGICAVLPR